MPETIDERAVRQPRKVELQAAMAAIEDQGVAEDEDPRVTPATIPPERLQLADAGILHLSPIVRQLIDLWKEPEEDDYGRLRRLRASETHTTRFR